MDFAPFVMAHTPLKMSIEEAKEEVRRAWTESYSPERNAEAVEYLSSAPFQYRIIHLVSRLFFRGIYFPQMGKRAWMKVLLQNRKTISGLVKEGVAKARAGRKNRKATPSTAPGTEIQHEASEAR
jgi:hypothetical protein